MYHPDLKLYFLAIAACKLSRNSRQVAIRHGHHMQPPNSASPALLPGINGNLCPSAQRSNALGWHFATRSRIKHATQQCAVRPLRSPRILFRQDNCDSHFCWQAPVQLQVSRSVLHFDSGFTYDPKCIGQFFCHSSIWGKKCREITVVVASLSFHNHLVLFTWKHCRTLHGGAGLQVFRRGVSEPCIPSSASLDEMF